VVARDRSTLRTEQRCGFRRSTTWETPAVKLPCGWCWRGWTPTPHRALSRYERAIQIDPGNPFAFLTLARYYAAIADPERALEHLDRAQSLLDPDGTLYRGAEPHLRGLRGWALADAGRPVEAGVLLSEARSLAPSVWDDGRLAASELR
jgi:tetratricopeptide (TPR) repeat protein